MTQRVLVVEDDADVVRLVGAYLEREGFEVLVAHDGESGLQRATADAPDLVVLDWMLPRLDGRAVLERLRAASRVPVILLTARGEETDRVLGLELGADDYVTKPFSPRELVARVRAVLRRRAPPDDDEDAIVHGSLRLEPAARRVSVSGTEVPLTALEFDLLHALARTPRRVQDRGELKRRVWGPEYGGADRIVDVHMSKLRQKLAAAGGPDLLRTVRGVGYSLE